MLSAIHAYLAAGGGTGGGSSGVTQADLASLDGRKLERKTVYGDESWEWWRSEADGGGHYRWDASSGILQFSGFVNDPRGSIMFETYAILGGNTNFTVTGGSRVGNRLIVAWDGGQRGKGTIRTYYTVGKTSDAFAAADEITTQEWAQSFLAAEQGVPRNPVAAHADLALIAGAKRGDWVYVADDAPVHSGQAWCYAYNGLTWGALFTLNSGDYERLANKPAIDDVTLDKNSTADDLGLAKKSALNALDIKVQAVEGRGGNLTAHDFGTATPTQEALTQYALAQINITDHLEIWNGTHVRNLYVDPVTVDDDHPEGIIDGHVWALTNTPGTTPPIFEWVDDGPYGMGEATNRRYGSTKGTEDPKDGSGDGKVSIKNGDMETIGFTALKTKIASIYDTIMFTPYVAAAIADMPYFAAWTGIVDSRNQDFSPNEYRSLTAKNIPTNNSRGGIFTEFKSGRAVGATTGADANLGLLTTTVPWGDTTGGYIKQVFELRLPNISNNQLDNQLRYERISYGASGEENWTPWVETSNVWKDVTLTRNDTYVSLAGSDSIRYNPAIKTLHMVMSGVTVKPRTWSRTSLIPFGNITMPRTLSTMRKSLFEVEARKSGTLMERQILPIELYPTGEMKLYFPSGVFTDDTTNLEIRGVGSFVLY
jgi:hypothetical protein